MADRVLTQTELNRATLARQLLLERKKIARARQRSSGSRACRRNGRPRRTSVSGRASRGFRREPLETRGAARRRREADRDARNAPSRHRARLPDVLVRAPRHADVVRRHASGARAEAR